MSSEQMSYSAPPGEEKDILQQIANGDQRAFRWVFDQYHNKLGLHVYRITKSRELAEEIVQDVFLKIWMDRAALSDVVNFQSYLYVVSKNHALNCLKTVAKQNAVNTELENIPDQIVADEFTEDNERYRLVDEAIDQLPRQQRLVYLMSRHERMQYAEIAERMSLSRETVKKYLQISTESITHYIRKQLTISLLLFLSNLF
jgi:RNA polymerase sigma-70 factor (family 1)